MLHELLQDGERLSSMMLLAAALIEVSAGLTVLWVMQCVTPDAGLQSYLGRVKLLHRGLLAVLSIILFWNAYHTLAHPNSSPRFVDLITIAAFLAVLAVSSYRHGLGPQENVTGSTILTRKLAPGYLG